MCRRAHRSPTANAMKAVMAECRERKKEEFMQENNYNPYEGNTYGAQEQGGMQQNAYQQQEQAGMQQNAYSSNPYGMQQGTQQNAYGGNPYGMQQGMQPPKQKQGFGIASLIVGILSMTLCAAFGSLFGIVGLILGIVACVRREKNRVFGIVGIVTSCVGIILGIIVIVAIVQYGTVDYHVELNGESIVSSDDVTEDCFAGKSFVAGDGSVIYFYEDGSFYWYQDDADHEDNYFVGIYETYHGDAAVTYITEDLSEYAVTEEELADYFDRNSDSELYTRENCTALTLRTEDAIVDGIDQVDEPYERHYMGFMADGYYDAANMDSGEYASLIEL